MVLLQGLTCWCFFISEVLLYAPHRGPGTRERSYAHELSAYHLTRGSLRKPGHVLRGAEYMG